MIMRLKQKIRWEIQHFLSLMSGNREGKEQLLGASSAKNTFIRHKMDHYKDMGRREGKKWNL
jgi:hypothetical protein